MRRILGFGVLVLGLGALGLWGRADHARSMEAQVRAAATPLVAGAQHRVTLEVSGRDLRLSGLAEDAAERAALLAPLRAVPGVRRVVDDLELLPLAAPYTLEANLRDGSLVFAGVMPSQAQIDDLAAAGHGTLDLRVANGEPPEWERSVAAGVGALSELNFGLLQMRDARLALSGEAANPAQRAAALALLEALPVPVVWTQEISLLDDGAPFSLTLSFAGAGLLAAGKVPVDLTPEALSAATGLPVEAEALQVARIGAADPFGAMALAGASALAVLEEGVLDIGPEGGSLSGLARVPAGRTAAIAALGTEPILAEIALLDDGAPFVLEAVVDGGSARALSGKIPADLQIEAADGLTRSALASPRFSAAAQSGLAALALLERGDLRIEAGLLRLSGAARTPAALARAEAALAALPEGFDRLVDLVALDDGTPFQLDLTLAGGAVSGAGKLPVDLSLAQVAGDFEITAISAQDGFDGAARAGLEALRGLESGTAEVAYPLVRLAGAARDPSAEVEVRRALASLPEGWSATFDLTLLDDGTPIDYTLSYAPAEGVTLEGKTPRDLDLDRIADLLDLEDVAGGPTLRTARVGGDPAATLALLAQIAPHLGAVEGFDLRGGDVAAAGVIRAAGGVAPAALAPLVPNWEVRAGAGAVQGAERINLRLGQREVFRGVAWVPVLEFAPDLGACVALSDGLQEAGRIQFLSGSADLDAGSVALINRLAGIAIPCAAAGLRLNIGGHTDSTGTAEANQTLSTERARVVAEALVARGVPVAALSALGYGQSEPVASNETEEGRAANRRTSLTWRAQ